MYKGMEVIFVMMYVVVFQQDIPLKPPPSRDLGAIVNPPLVKEDE